jgi:hypothetical protein
VKEDELEGVCSTHGREQMHKNMEGVDWMNLAQDRYQW